jgi:hypothetical protein
MGAKLPQPPPKVKDYTASFTHENNKLTTNAPEPKPLLPPTPPPKKSQEKKDIEIIGSLTNLATEHLIQYTKLLNEYNELKIKHDEFRKAVDDLLNRSPLEFRNQFHSDGWCLFCYNCESKGHKADCPWKKLEQIKSK